MTIERDLVEANPLAKPRKVDAVAGLIEGVKILGLGKGANGNDYPSATVKDAADRKLFEGVPVYLNHPKKGEVGARDVREKFGWLENASFQEAVGDFGNLRYNPKHPFADQFAWLAEHKPDQLGLSINARGRTQGPLVEAITRVSSVDVVSDPSMTRGLFESKGAAGDDPAGANGTTGTQENGMSLKEADLNKLKAERPDLVQSILAEAAAGDDAKKQAAETKRLREENDGFKAQQAVAAKRSKADALIAEAKLPKEAVSETFTTSLIEAKDEAAMKALVEDRKALVLGTNVKKPKAAEQTLQESVGLAGMKVGDFVKKITS